MNSQQKWCGTKKILTKQMKSPRKHTATHLTTVHTDVISNLRIGFKNHNKNQSLIFDGSQPHKQRFTSIPNHQEEDNDDTVMNLITKQSVSQNKTEREEIAKLHKLCEQKCIEIITSDNIDKLTNAASNWKHHRFALGKHYRRNDS